MRHILHQRFWMAFFGLLTTMRLFATDINSAQDLKNTLGSATISGNTVTLTANVSISSTLRIIGGTMTLDLNGKTITYDRSSINASAGSDIGIEINGSTSNIIVKNGSIIVRAAKGNDNSTIFSKGGAGSNAFAIVLNSGSVSLLNLNMTAIPGNGGNGGWGGSTGANGSSWVIDPNNGHKLNEMIPTGAYVEGSVNYESEGLNQQNVTVALTTYHATYNTNGGSPQPAVGTYTIESPLASLPANVTKSGYTFKGWLYNGNKVDVASLPVSSVREANTYFTFNADWLQVYSISYNLDGGTNPADSPVSFTIESETITLPIPTKPSNRFLGWYDNVSFAGNAITQIAKGSTGDRQLYAKWESVYTIDYNVNLGTMPENAPTMFTDKEHVTLPLPTRIGYDFGGWFADAAFSGGAVAEIPIGSTGDRTYYAKWIPIKYNITYNYNGGNAPSEAISEYTIESLVTLPRPIRDYYYFEGWFADAEFSGTSIATIPKGTTGNKTFYAKWSPAVYTITLNTMGGSTLAPIKYDIEKETFLLPTKSTKAGYSFAGWYEDAACTVAYSTEVKQGTHGDFTLFAKWTLTQYKIEYDTYHGSNPSDAPTTYSVDDEVVLPIPVREAFTFAGWHASELLNDAVVSIISKGSTGNRKFYAKWGSANSINFSQPVGGDLRVMSGETEVKSGDRVGAGVELKIYADPTDKNVTLKKLIVNGTVYTSSPLTITTPQTGGTIISAIFEDDRQQADAPIIKTNPSATDFVVSGSEVEVSLAAVQEGDTIYYNVDDMGLRPYTKPFKVSTLTATSRTIKIVATARRNGMKDGTAMRNITFHGQKVAITFDLPRGITAHSTDGGEVLSAVATGGMFEFVLKIDTPYFSSLIPMKVFAGDSLLKADAYGVYALQNLKKDTKITVLGPVARMFTVRLLQTANGTIAFSDSLDADSLRLAYNETIEIKAEAEEYYKLASWSDGETLNPRIDTVRADMTLSAKFVQEYPDYKIVLPIAEGLTVKPLTGYPTTVRHGDKFKFYMYLDADHSNSQPTVYVNGEKIEPVQNVYSIYNISQHQIIAVDGVTRNRISCSLPQDVSGISLSNGKPTDGESYTSDELILIKAIAPEGKTFVKWNDGVLDNPRIVGIGETMNQLPIFSTSTAQQGKRLILHQQAGALISVQGDNADNISADTKVLLKLVIHPEYSQSEVRLTLDGKEQIPTASLRATSEKQTLYYALDPLTADAEVKLEGLEINKYNITIEGPKGGKIGFDKAGLLSSGTVITFLATPAADNVFAGWSTGNTLNPYSYVVKADAVLGATFLSKGFATSNESISNGNGYVRVVGNDVVINLEEGAAVSIWKLNGQFYKKTQCPSGQTTITLPTGAYIIKAPTKEAVKAIIK